MTKYMICWGAHMGVLLHLPFCTYLPKKMEQTERSETSPNKIQMPGNYLEENTRQVIYFNTCTVHILLFCTMTNKSTIISQIIALLHVSTLSCHPQTACNQYLAKLHKYVNCKTPWP
jgi:hypothetical protein